jgi:hypothetical protein
MISLPFNLLDGSVRDILHCHATRLRRCIVLRHSIGACRIQGTPKDRFGIALAPFNRSRQLTAPGIVVRAYRPSARLTCLRLRVLTGQRNAQCLFERRSIDRLASGPGIHGDLLDAHEENRW